MQDRSRFPGVSHLEKLIHLCEVEDRDGKREGEGHGVTEVDDRVEPRQLALAPEATEERLRRRAVLRRLQAHLRLGSTPRRDLGHLGLRSFLESLPRAPKPRLEPILHVDDVLDRVEDKEPRARVAGTPARVFRSVGNALASLRILLYDQRAASPLHREYFE